MTTQDKLQREIDLYVSKTPTSRGLQDSAEQYLPGGSSRGTAYFAPYPHFIERGEGHYMIDADGNRMLDFMINATSLILGHAHPEIVSALQEQAARGTAFTGPTEAQVRLAKILTDRIPSADSIRFTNSGTEGTLLAVRAARAFTGRPKIAKFEGGYHGSHEYVSVSVHPPLEKLDPSGPTPIPEYPGMPQSILDDVVVLPYNDLEWCERVLREGRNEIACVIMEPVVSSFGYLPAQKAFLQGIRDLTTELGMVLIFDEVQSFRVSSGGAQEDLGVVPDLTALGKTIGGGLPVGAFGGKQELMDLFDPTAGGATLAHAGTFNANPMTMVAGEVAMNHLTPDVFERLNALGDELRAKLRAVFDELEVHAQVTGIGSLFGIHFTSEEIVDYRNVIRADGQMRRALFMGLLNEGILLQTGTAGSLNTLTTEAEADTLVDATRRVVQRVR
ncbi:MAG: aspartate aminotransferase family protein [SAR202 cluster bacterium]|nr:aspartate aminotransferase family protein [SAR202 cluster bacterium]